MSVISQGRERVTIFCKDIARLWANAFVVAHKPPKALIHQQDARHHSWLLHAQRLHGGTEATMHNESIHLAEEDTKVRTLNLKELA